MKIGCKAHQGCFDVNADRYIHKMEWRGIRKAYMQLLSVGMHNADF